MKFKETGIGRILTHAACVARGRRTFSEKEEIFSCIRPTRPAKAGIAIHVFVVYLMRANAFQGPLEGVGPENRDYFGP